MTRPEMPPGVKQFLDKYPECHTAVVLNDFLTDSITYQDRTIIFAPHYCASLISALYDEH